MTDTDAPDLDIEDEEIDPVEQPEEGGEDEAPDDFSFGDDEDEGGGDDAQESGVLRDARKREREKDRRIRALERELETSKTIQQPAIVDPGPEPDFDRDYDQFDGDPNLWAEHHKKWSAAKQAFDTQQRETEQTTTAIKQAYEQARTNLRYPDMDNAESRVFAEVGPVVRDILVFAKAPELVVALDKNPQQLENLLKIKQPIDQILAIGELKGKLKMGTRTSRKPPAPDEPVRGSASIAPRDYDAQLKKLEAEADRTGNRNKVQEFKRRQKERSK